MRLLLRIAAIAVAGSALYAAGAVNGATQRQPAAAGGLFTFIAVAAAIWLLIMALTGTGLGDAASPTPRSYVPALRAVFVFVAAMSLFGLLWLRGIPYPPEHDATSYHNDAIALDECAAQALLRGEDPYATFTLFRCYGERRLGADRTTPLRLGAFADVEVYPTEEQLDAAWDSRQREIATSLGISWEPPPDFEFTWRLSYPALSVLLILPWVAAGWDANLIYVLCLLAATALVLLRAPAGTRPLVLTGLLAAASVPAFTAGGSADLLYALPLVAAWLWRERRGSAVALGVASAVKQLAWPFAIFYLIQVAAQRGWSEAARRAAIAAAVFGVANAPFVLWDPAAWLRGILTPIAEPMFARGAGLVTLSANGVLPFFPEWVYLALEVAVAAIAVVVAWRRRYTSPELGVVLAMVPLFFAHRSLFSYFFLLPLFAFAGLVRMPAGELEPAAIQRAGALTVLAMPARGGPAGPR
ncbi:MAG: DUF2029 domain-containing protein [Chloroflexi bacterium]|nr:DUF2029 domain-containing protein [Chloroflexota bacterium]